MMSSYFDDKSKRVSEAAESFRGDDQSYLRAVADIESELIHDVTLASGDREFPADLREKAMGLIARCHVGVFASLPPLQQARTRCIVMRYSELVEEMHSLFHELASRRIVTRFGHLSDHPRDIWQRRDEHDAA
jgi:hypothetical protein